MESVKTQWALALAAGLLLVSAFPGIGLSAAVWFALVPLFWLGEARGLVRPALLAVPAGLAFFGPLLWWVHTFHWLAWPLLTAACALQFPVFMLGYKLLRRRFLYAGFLLVPAWWVALEAFRGDGYWGFPWGQLGYTQWNFPPLLQVTALTGVAGLSFLIVLANYALFRLALCRLLDNRVLGIALAVIVLLGAAVVAGGNAIPEKRLPATDRIDLIQPNFPAVLGWGERQAQYLQTLGQMTRQAHDHRPRLVIWPETVIPVPVEQGPDGTLTDFYGPALAAMSRAAPLLLGRALTGPDGRDYNCALLVDGDTRAVAGGKIHLVPFGETLPGLHDFAWLESFGRSVGISDFAPVARKAPFPFAGGRLGLLICFEATFGELTRALVRDGATLLVNITNDIWSGSPTAHEQHFAMSVLRAAENRRYLVRGGNSGVSAVVDPFGRVLVRTPVMQSAILTENVVLDAAGLPLTLYTRWGDWFARGCGAVSALVLVWLGARQRHYYRRADGREC